MTYISNTTSFFLNYPGSNCWAPVSPLASLHCPHARMCRAATVRTSLVSGAPDNGDRLRFGDTLVSEDGRCSLVIKEDAEIAIYVARPSGGPAVLVWSNGVDTESNGWMIDASATYLIMWTDGNLAEYTVVIEDDQGVTTSLWASRSTRRESPYTARLNDADCRLVVTCCGSTDAASQIFSTPGTALRAPPRPPPSPMPPPLPPASPPPTLSWPPLPPHPRE